MHMHFLWWLAPMSVSWAATYKFVDRWSDGKLGPTLARTLALASSFVAAQHSLQSPQLDSQWARFTIWSCTGNLAQSCISLFMDFFSPYSLTHSTTGYNMTSLFLCESSCLTKSHVRHDVGATQCLHWFIYPSILYSNGLHPEQQNGSSKKDSNQTSFVPTASNCSDVVTVCIYRFKPFSLALIYFCISCP